MHKTEQSCQSAKLNSYHCDIDEGSGARFGCFVVADKSTLAHEPAEHSLNDPAAGQYVGGVYTIGDVTNRCSCSIPEHQLLWNKVRRRP